MPDERTSRRAPDLAAYLARVGLPDPPPTSAAGLRRLQEAHLAAIPFENLDVRLGRKPSLDLASLEAKLVRRRRGGYCFEHNTLFAAVLGELGFEVATLEARVRPPGATRTLPRTHMTLRVEAEDRSWLADVGFGGDGPLHPVPLDGEPADQPGGRYRVAKEDHGALVLQRTSGAGWTDLYAFRLTPALPVDFEVAHHYTSTHPSSPFVTGLTAQRTTRRARYVLRGRSWTRRDATGEERREGLGDGEIHRLMVEALGLEVTRDEVGRALSGVR